MRRRVVVLAMAALASIGSVAACSPSGLASPSSLPAIPTPRPIGSNDDFVEIPGLGVTRIDVPRPTGPAPATCEPMGPRPSDGQTVEQRVAGLRRIGLFANRTGTDTELAAEIEQRNITDFGDMPSPDDPITELVVALADDSRVWWGDLEADVHQENLVYEQFLEEWAAISAGAFEPSTIEESWEGPEGPLTVSLTLDGQSIELHPVYLEDWVDPRILSPINEAIAGSGRQFEPYRAFDQSLYLVALTPDEKRALERDRGWCFEWPAEG